MNFMGMPLEEGEVLPRALRSIRLRAAAAVLIASKDAERAGYARGAAIEARKARYYTLAWCFAVSAVTHFLTRMAP